MTRRIHLTFDDGPHPIYTPRLLDELKQAGILATFFVRGQNLETPEGKELIRRAAADGHQIGNHTYSHPHLTDLSEDQIRREILINEELIGDANKGVKLFRPPYGHHNSLVDRVAQELGYKLVLWNIDTYDWHPKHMGRWIERAMKGIMTQEYSVVLAHDIHITTVGKVGHLIEKIRMIPDSNFIVSDSGFIPPPRRRLLDLSPWALFRQLKEI